MARKKQLEAAKRKQALCDELAASRIALAHGKSLLKDNLNVKDQLSKRLSSNFGKGISTKLSPSKLLGFAKPASASLNLSSLNLSSLCRYTLSKVDNNKVIFGSALLGVATISILTKRRKTERYSIDDSGVKNIKKKRKMRLSISGFLVGIAVKQVRKQVTKVITKKVKSHIKGKLIQKAANLAQ